MISRTRHRLVTLAAAGILSSGAAFAQSGGQQPAAAGGQQSGSTNTRSDGASSSSNAQPGGGQAQAKGQSQASDNAPEGFILVQERVVLLTANEPQNHFLRAQQLMAQNDAKAAAAEVNVGAAYLDMQAGRGKQQSGGALSSAADQLRSIASQMRKGGGNAQQQQQQLTEAFASANHALATHFQAMASKAVSNNRGIAAGYDLAGAADSLAAAYAWSRKDAPQDATSVIADARRVASTLIAADSDGSGGSPTAQGNQQGNQQSTDQARTAGARQGQDQGQGTGGAAPIPADASKVVDQLGQAIQQSTDQFKASGSRDQKAEAAKQ